MGKILSEMDDDQVELCYQHMKYQEQLDLDAAHSNLGKTGSEKKDFVKSVNLMKKSNSVLKNESFYRSD